MEQKRSKENWFYYRYTITTKEVNSSSKVESFYKYQLDENLDKIN